MSTSARDQFRLTYEISPVFLTGGLAGIPGGKIPIIQLTQPESFQNLSQAQASDLDLNDYFGHFRVLPGATLIDMQLGRYPFANQAVAANAVIAQPLTVSLLFICPARLEGGYTAKLTTMQSLRQSLYQHAQLGGTYTVATPSFIYTDVILTGLRDVTDGESKQVQDMWQFDFEQPLLTTAQAQAAYNSMTARINNQVQVYGDPPSATGTQNSQGNPGTSIGPELLPQARPFGGAVGNFPGPIREANT